MHVRARLLIAFILAAAPSTADARDSTWLVCKGIADHGTKTAKTDVAKTYIVANVLEHRGPTGDGRSLAVTLIYGDNVSRGEAVGKTGDDWVGHDAPLKLRTVEASHRVTFTGTGTLSGDMTWFILTGQLDANYGQPAAGKPAMEALSAKLTCDELDDQAIGH